MQQKIQLKKEEFVKKEKTNPVSLHAAPLVLVQKEESVKLRKVSHKARAQPPNVIKEPYHLMWRRLAKHSCGVSGRANVELSQQRALCSVNGQRFLVLSWFNGNMGNRSLLRWGRGGSEGGQGDEVSSSFSSQMTPGGVVEASQWIWDDRLT